MSARITIPLSAAPEVITDVLRRALKAHGYELMRYQGASGARAADAEQIEMFCRDVGNNASQALMVIDETPIEEVDVEYEPGITPRTASARGRK